jgi:DNA-binding NarL/FixJ family response regulator
MSHPKRDPVPIPSALTRQERLVLKLAAEGMTNRQIADLLYVKQRTADIHLTNIYRKLAVHSRLQAVMVAKQQGLLPDP